MWYLCFLLVIFFISGVSLFASTLDSFYGADPRAFLEAGKRYKEYLIAQGILALDKQSQSTQQANQAHLMPPPPPAEPSNIMLPEPLGGLPTVASAAQQAVAPSSVTAFSTPTTAFISKKPQEIDRQFSIHKGGRWIDYRQVWQDLFFGGGQEERFGALKKIKILFSATNTELQIVKAAFRAASQSRSPTTVLDQDILEKEKTNQKDRLIDFKKNVSFLKTVLKKLVTQNMAYNIKDETERSIKIGLKINDSPQEFVFSYAVEWKV
ncbi:DUF669 domain-containing protein [Alphaproteobacteria bacterium]|nr:DUF669 domain-containing protein [Alphaproteobacteria bacterium]